MRCDIEVNNANEEGWRRDVRCMWGALGNRVG